MVGLKFCLKLIAILAVSLHMSCSQSAREQGQDDTDSSPAAATQASEQRSKFATDFELVLMDRGFSNETARKMANATDAAITKSVAGGVDFEAIINSAIGAFGDSYAATDGDFAENLGILLSALQIAGSQNLSSLSSTQDNINNIIESTAQKMAQAQRFTSNTDGTVSTRSPATELKMPQGDGTTPPDIRGGDQTSNRYTQSGDVLIRADKGPITITERPSFQQERTGLCTEKVMYLNHLWLVELAIDQIATICKKIVSSGYVQTMTGVCPPGSTNPQALGSIDTNSDGSVDLQPKNGPKVYNVSLETAPECKTI